MKILTIATKAEGYFDLLKYTANKWGYELQVLGWEKKWKGFSWKLELYFKALSKLPLDEPVICVDGYDVVVIAPANEMLEKFKYLNEKIIFSGQRYFPNQKWLRNLADQAMSNNLVQTIGKKGKNTNDYSRPCMGLLIGNAGELVNIFQKLLKIESEISINDDQTLLNIYKIKHPQSLKIDLKCQMFQNLWRTKEGLYGKISSKDKNCEVEIIFDKNINSWRVKNKQYNTTACFLHAPFNLDMGLLLNEMNMNTPPLNFRKNWNYLRYSILHHAKRWIKLLFA